MHLETLEQWREAASGLIGRGRGRRYPADLRVRAAALARSAMAAGMKQSEVCRRLGVPDETLKGWMGHGELVAVSVIPDTPAMLRLVLGGGHAGLTLDEMAALLRRLS